MKTVDEWLLEFNLQWNNIASDKAPGLDEYEISVFLTRAQESVVIASYKGALGEPFESTEEVTAYLGTLVRQADCELASVAEVEAAYRLSEKSVLYKNPQDMLFRTWEGCKITNSCGEVSVPVIPVTQDDYWRTVRNPFRRSNGRKVLRLSYVKDEHDGQNTYGNTPYSELVSAYPISSYTVRYLSKPEPIILKELSGGLSIDGKTAPMTCKLPEVLHQSILAEAVRMAKVVWNM